MNKKTVLLFAVTGLLCLAGFSFASVTITNPLGSTNDFKTLLTKIAGGVGALVASLGTIMLIVAGILYLISAGSPEKMATAKKALIYAIIGIAIGITATAIVAAILAILK